MMPGKRRKSRKAKAPKEKKVSKKLENFDIRNFVKEKIQELGRVRGKDGRRLTGESKKNHLFFELFDQFGGILFPGSKEKRHQLTRLLTDWVGVRRILSKRYAKKELGLAENLFLLESHISSLEFQRNFLKENSLPEVVETLEWVQTGKELAGKHPSPAAKLKNLGDAIDTAKQLLEANERLMSAHPSYEKAFGEVFKEKPLSKKQAKEMKATQRGLKMLEEEIKKRGAKVTKPPKFPSRWKTLETVNRGISLQLRLLTDENFSLLMERVNYWSKRIERLFR